MIKSLSFDPIFSPTIVIVVGFFLFAYFIYKEFQRNQKFLINRIVALSLVAVSILGILLRPSYQDVGKSEAIILLTKGFSQNKIDSIIEKNPKLKVVRTEDANSYPNASLLNSWHDLQDENIGFVAGEGIPHHAIDLLSKKSFQFIPASLPNGITSLFPADKVYANQRNLVRGIFNGSEKTSLKLIGPGGVEDSVVVDSGKTDFSLSFVPKQTGLFIYRIESRDGKGIRSIDRLPIEVLPERQLRILFIQKYPTAEVRFLKNFLSEKKHQLILRYQTSKSNFIYEYSNTLPIRFDHLQPELLNSLDLLVIDQQSYNAFSASEKSNLKKSIRDGLGVLILLHDAKEQLLNEFHPLKTKVSSKDTAHIRLSRAMEYVVPVLPIELKADPSIISVARNEERILSGYFFSGSGKVGFQFIQETFRLGLEGNTADYALLWSSLIEKTSRSMNQAFKIKLNTPFPYYANEPLDVGVIASGAQPSLYADSLAIPLIEDVSLDDYWRGKNWAGKSGWHQFMIKEDSVEMNYFVSSAEEWNALRIANQINETKILQDTELINSPKVKTDSYPVASILFYLLFLFSAAFLWLAPKI